MCSVAIFNHNYLLLIQAMSTHVMIINRLTDEHTSQLPRGTSLIPLMIHVVPQECVVSLKKVSYIIIKEADYHDYGHRNLRLCVIKLSSVA